MRIFTIITIIQSVFGFDSTYSSESFDNVWCGLSCDDLACDPICQREHITADGWPDGWQEGEFACDDNESYRQYLFANYCNCKQCQKDCSLNEMYDVDACNTQDIPTIRNDVAKKIASVIFARFGGSADNKGEEEATQRRRMPIVTMAMLGQAMSFGQEIYTAAQDENKLLNGVIRDVNERFDQMIECVGQEISKSAAEDHVDEMQVCFNEYDNAIETRDAELKLDRTFGTWEAFNNVVASKFDNLDEDAIYFRNLLIPLQDFAALYALLSVDLLAYLREIGHADYDMHLENTLDDLRQLRIWVYTAKAIIVEDMRDNMHALPCRNDENIESQLLEWKNRFEIANIEPIEQFISQFQTLKSVILSGDVCEAADVSANVIHVLSTDHITSIEGKYFNFDQSEVDQIFGDADWNEESLSVYNERTGITEDVKLWSSSNGGSIGNAHGRRQDWSIASEGNWEVGDILIYRPDSYTTCGDEYECLQGTCQSSFTILDDPLRPCSVRPIVEVISIDHSEAEDGMFFNFDIAQMDAAMGEGNWESRAVPAYNYRTGRVVDVWMSRADGNGRFAYGERGMFDWQIGDELAFNLDSSECGEGFYCVPVGNDEGLQICQYARCNADEQLPFIDVNSIKHTVGNQDVFGSYFQFDADAIDLDTLLGDDWEDGIWNVYHSRTKEVIQVRLWREGYGRKEPVDIISSDDWHYGDRIVFNFGTSDECGNDLYCLPIGDDDDWACKEELLFGEPNSQ